jgi:hypothetical protein
MSSHWGGPRNRMALVGTTCWTNTLKTGEWVAHRFARRITHWYGVSWPWGDGYFMLGLLRVGEQRLERHPEEPPHGDH